MSMSRQEALKEGSTTPWGMSRDLADEVTARPTWIDQVGDFTRQAPIQSLAVAFLIGVLLTRQ
jgi:hypothetical protein